MWYHEYAGVRVLQCYIRLLPECTLWNKMQFLYYLYTYKDFNNLRDRPKSSMLPEKGTCDHFSYTLLINCLNWNKKAKQLSSPLRKRAQCFISNNETVSEFPKVFQNPFLVFSITVNFDAVHQSPCFMWDSKILVCRLPCPTSKGVWSSS